MSTFHLVIETCINHKQIQVHESVTNLPTVATIYQVWESFKKLTNFRTLIFWNQIVPSHSYFASGFRNVYWLDIFPTGNMPEFSTRMSFLFCFSGICQMQISYFCHLKKFLFFIRAIILDRGWSCLARFWKRTTTELF